MACFSVHPMSRVERVLSFFLNANELYLSKETNDDTAHGLAALLNVEVDCTINSGIIQQLVNVAQEKEK